MYINENGTEAMKESLVCQQFLFSTSVVRKQWNEGQTPKAAGFPLFGNGCASGPDGNKRKKYVSVCKLVQFQKEKNGLCSGMRKMEQYPLYRYYMLSP